MRHIKIYCEIAMSKGVTKRALKVALVVGTTLNLINQGETMLSLNLGEINMLKFLLTYLVPYSVTTYTATAMKVEFQIGTKAIIETDLKCKGCGVQIHVKEGEIIPECPKCGVNTHWKLK
ncbi:nitrate/nitrite transporter NrtS [Sulfurimonas sp. CS5]|uniref:nitrate/nitrite transporter NrtS n=1 Tax=Sulfurimonas sp. CS5 TaxID=3391145 RepID=UPI0039ED73F4